MSASPRHDTSPASPTAHEEIARLAERAEIRSAYAWFRSHEAQLAEWQLALSRIPAPPLGEAARATWLKERFQEFRLEETHTDEVGNVFGILPGVDQQFVALSAHLDTVFPAGTPLNFRQTGNRLYGPGVSDNGAGVTALLAIAAVLRAGKIFPNSSILFVGNVGEEGEGNLCGMRHIFSVPRWKKSIRYNIILDGAGSDTIVAEALG